MAKLREQGTLDNTLVVILADHGEAFGEHDFWTHGILYEEQLRVPLVLRWPADSIPTARFRLETNVTDEPITVSVLLDSHRPGWSCEESEALRRLLGLAGCEHD